MAGCWVVCPAVAGEVVPHPASWSGFSVDADLIYQRKVQKIIVFNTNYKLTSKL